MKIFRYVSIAIMFLTLFVASDVAAQAVDFDITASSGWVHDIAHPSNEQGNKYSSVNWISSNRGNHTMWFGIFNDSFIKKGQMLYTSKKADAFLVDLPEGLNAYIAARRENSGDPFTNVKGIWAA